MSGKVVDGWRSGGWVCEQMSELRCGWMDEWMFG